MLFIIAAQAAGGGGGGRWRVRRGFRSVSNTADVAIEPELSGTPNSIVLRDGWMFTVSILETYACTTLKGCIVFY